jgi:hypothetical protein
VSSFRREIVVTVDGVDYKCQTKAIDYTNAEVSLARDGGTVEKNAMALRFRIAFAVFRRCHPDEPTARSFPVFLDVLDDIDETPDDLEDGDPLDPTPLAGTVDSP